MVTPQRFIEIWTYRYHKYIGILISCLLWAKTIINIKMFKIFNPNTKTIGILLAEHFGDIVACEPICRALKKQYPNSKIYWIVKKSFRELVEFNPNIDEIIEEYNVFYSILLNNKNNFDSFHNCHLSDLRSYGKSRIYLQNNLALSQNILTNNYFNFGNILEVFAKVGGVPVLKDAPQIYFSKKINNKIDNLLLPKKYIVIHCHSNFSPKDWKINYWKKLVNDLLKEFDYDIIEVGLESYLGISDLHYHNLCGKFTILETAEIIKRADYFIGIDSGPAHLANAVGTFGFLLFGKLIDFENYMPYSGQYQTLENAKFIVSHGKPCSELPYDIVWKDILETIKQRKNKA
jgi:heptosyltransferase III